MMKEVSENIVHSSLPSTITIAYKSQITLECLLPVILQVTYADQTTERVDIPADVWRKNGDSFEKTVDSFTAIVRVELDPMLETADADTSNNVYPKEIETHSFDVDPKSPPPSNPMQQTIKDD